MAKTTATAAEPATVRERKQEILFPTEKLIGSKLFKDYHRDFLRALLPKKEYGKKEAEAIVTKYFTGGRK
jgi:hypothetical protein